jgi:hypothetical protein
MESRTLQANKQRVVDRSVETLVVFANVLSCLGSKTWMFSRQLAPWMSFMFLLDMPYAALDWLSTDSLHIAKVTVTFDSDLQPNEVNLTSLITTPYIHLNPLSPCNRLSGVTPYTHAFYESGNKTTVQIPPCIVLNLPYGSLMSVIRWLWSRDENGSFPRSLWLWFFAGLRWERGWLCFDGGVGVAILVCWCWLVGHMSRVIAWTEFYFPGSCGWCRQSVTVGTASR